MSPRSVAALPLLPALLLLPPVSLLGLVAASRRPRHVAVLLHGLGYGGPRIVPDYVRFLAHFPLFTFEIIAPLCAHASVSDPHRLRMAHIQTGPGI